MDNSFYSRDELAGLGLKSYGENVLISRFARFYSPVTIEIGSHVRIDDFCILSGTIKLGSHIHISAYCALYGKFGIVMEDYSGLSPRCTVFSASDDFSGDYLIGPMVDESLTNVTGGEVRIGRYSQLGAGCVVMPKVKIGEGVAVGSMSLVLHDLDGWKIYKGIPAAFHKNRRNKLLAAFK
ncbi:MAG: acyltransferase [Bacteroidales bacterium]|jgi:acetyltransferase-like isoleucine patch superfamily enzyme